jgi:predicted HAD superfamily Cof-like phosphohydrolase
MGATLPSVPTVASDDVVVDLIGLLYEESRELSKAMKRGDLEEVADGCADLVYSAIGAAMLHGINLTPIFEDVHRANMSKGVAAGGFGRLTADGKGTKDNWDPPRTLELLALQTARGNGLA